MGEQSSSSSSSSSIAMRVSLGRAKDWRYIGEGAANVVCAYVGDLSRTASTSNLSALAGAGAGTGGISALSSVSSEGSAAAAQQQQQRHGESERQKGGERDLAHLDGKALRLKKRAHRHTASSSSSSAPAEEEERRAIEVEGRASEREDAFARLLVAGQLVPTRYLPENSSRVLVSERFLRELGDVIEQDRPPFRRHEGALDERQEVGTLVDDLTGTSDEAFTVEIKPKWGFLPCENAEEVPALAREAVSKTKLSHCRYCMYRNALPSLLSQHAIADEAVRAYTDRFCPLDLYAAGADEERTVQAVRKLVDKRADALLQAQGHDVTFNNLRLFHRGKLLSSPDIGVVEAAVLPFTREDLATKIARALRSSGVLELLRDLQRTLDPFDVQGLAAIHGGPERLQAFADKHAKSSPDGRLPIEQWLAWHDRWQARTTDTKGPGDNGPDDDDDMLAYILGSTFKDCSIMIKFDAVRDEKEPDVKLVDLDQKPLARLRSYFDKDAEIVRKFERFEKQWQDTIGSELPVCSAP